MTEAIKMPSRPGYYWYAATPANVTPAIAQVYQDPMRPGRLAVMVLNAPSTDAAALEEMPGDFYGPIMSPFGKR